MLRETLAVLDADGLAAPERDFERTRAESQTAHHAGALPGMDFPSTRYYGSKRRQLEWLRGEFGLVKGSTVLDAFGGTGVVSHLWRSLGWEVTYNDAFHFNTISARAIFSDSTRRHPEEEVQDFLQRIKPFDGFVTHTFDGLYFFRDENQWLDGMLTKLGGEPDSFRNLLLHCLFQACLQKRPFNLFHRANLHLRTSKRAVKFGNRTTWAKSFSNLMIAAYREVARMQTSAIHSFVRVTSPGPADAITGHYDVVYIDPPYFKHGRKTESYLQRYHFLEGLARYEEWPSLLDGQSPIKQIREGSVPEWASKVEFLDNLIELIDKHRRSQVVLSYVSGEYPSELDLIEIFKQRFNSFRLSRRSFSRALSQKKVFELLLVGRP